MRRHVTDLEILKLIHTRYFSTFKSYAHSKDRVTKIYVPIKIEDLAQDLGINEYILFGRLHHHIGQKYKYKNENNLTVSLFEAFLGDEKHCINFPYLDGVVANLEDKKKINTKTFWLSMVAIVISGGKLLFDFFF